MTPNAERRAAALAALTDEELKALLKATMVSAANARARAAQRQRARKALDTALPNDVVATASEQVWAEEIDEAYGRRQGFYD